MIVGSVARRVSGWGAEADAALGGAGGDGWLGLMMKGGVGRWGEIGG